MVTGRTDIRIRVLLPLLLICVGSVVSTAVADQLNDDAPTTDPYTNISYIRLLSQQGAILPMQQLMAKAMPTIKGTIIETGLELENGRLVYEIEYLNAQGKVREAYFQASDGRPVIIDHHKAAR